MKQHQSMFDRAVEHIRAQQSPDGSFLSLSSFLPNDFSNAPSRKTTFFTANILACLQTVPEQTADIREAGIKFLLAQKSERWSFNYWARDAQERITLPYPDDLDDTFAALAAIARHDATMIDGHAFSAIAKILTAQEAREGGPYRTWLMSDDAPTAWRDIDIGVNGTIGYFLSLIGVQLPLLKKFFGAAIGKNQLTSPYYPGVLPVVYFLSRFYGGGKKDDSEDSKNARKKLADIVVERLHRHDQNNGGCITTLERAMAISSLINLGCTERDVVGAQADLLTARLEREGFLPYAFCIDPARGGRRCYAGASALTAAFCAEALAGCANFCSNTADHTAALPALTIHNHIRGLARTACQTAGADLCAMAIAQIERTSDETITTLAYEFYEALYKKGIFVAPDVVEPLSLANLFGWMAYDIYDDALDGEDGTALIPCANVFLRTLAETYHALGTRDARIASLFRMMMDLIDNANAWEQTHCRISAGSGAESNATLSDILTCPLPSFGDHQTLADRSIGHAVGPLALLFLAGYDARSEAYKNVELFFRHYLIARQLHDDAHDWTDDLLRGRVNSIGAIVLDDFRKEYSGGEKTMTVAAALPKLKKIFWEETIDTAVCMILSHTASARRARENSPLGETDFAESMLQRLESGARRAIVERDKAVIFLKDYKDSRTPGA